MEVKWCYARLRYVRWIKGVAQFQAAYDLGVSRSTYIRYESGVRVPDVVMLAKFCGYFQCTADYLLGLSSAPGEVRNGGEGGAA